MDVKSVVVDAYATVGKNLLLVSISSAYSYENGKRTDTVIGYKYEVVMPEKMYEKLSVRIDGDQKLELPENETPQVVFEGLKMSLYWTPQGYNIKATANNIKFVNPSKKVG